MKPLLLFELKLFANVFVVNITSFDVFPMAFLHLFYFKSELSDFRLGGGDFLHLGFVLLDELILLLQKGFQFVDAVLE